MSVALNQRSASFRGDLCLAHHGPSRLQPIKLAGKTPLFFAILKYSKKSLSRSFDVHTHKVEPQKPRFRNLKRTTR